MNTNPIVNGWYADPEARIYQGKKYIYVTRSLPFKEQMNIDCVYETEEGMWAIARGIIRMSDFPYVTHAVWAPTVIEKEGKYYMIFASNNIQSDEETGGLEIAVADHPLGPFRGYLGKPLVPRFIFGAQPIDAHLFKDEDEKIYLYFGGWGHCVLALLNPEMNGFLPIKGEEIFMEITPEGYVEGPMMLKRKGVYHFMYSTGCWTDGSYGVLACQGKSPAGPFCAPEKILWAKPPVADGPGHHGCIKIGEDRYQIVYHRRIVGDTNPHHRILCIDELRFENDRILPVEMT